MITALHALLWILTAVTFMISSCSNPGRLKKDYTLLHLLENFHPSDICPRCEVLTTPRSQHCNICNQCVQNWDHHCPWINNCVGVRNHGAFFFHLLFVFLLFGFYIEPPITHTFYSDGTYDDSSLYYKFCVGCKNNALFWSVYALNVLLALFCFLLVFYILIMSCYKFIKDQAQVPSEEAGNAISAGEGTNNRVGMTALVLDKKYGQHLSEVVGEHEELTMA